MLLAEWTAEVLKNNAIDRVFLYPGGTIAPLVNACLKAGIKLKCFKSEQGAAYAALAFARITGKPQVVMVTSGPGVTNAMTPLADAYYDSTPLVLFTGQVGTGDLNSRPSVRQRGFQETPTVALATPISKKASCIMTPGDAFRDVPEAFALALSERKGPVVIDFPMDMQRLELAPEQIPALLGSALELAEKHAEPLRLEFVEEIAAAAAQATRPILLLGHGALEARAYAEYKKLADKLGAFVVTSLLGIGAHDTEAPNHLGFIGHTGHWAANKAVHDCDFLLVLGSRLDVRQTGTVLESFVPNGRIAWVDKDPVELANARITATWKVCSDAGVFTKELLKALPTSIEKTDSVWSEDVRAMRSSQIDDAPKDGSSCLEPRPVLQRLCHFMKQTAFTVTTGVGCHQHWAARHLPFRPNDRSLLTSGGHGTMGYDLPSAIGAAMAQPEQKVLCVVGDGSLLMNVQELATLSEMRLPVKVLVLNNSRLAMVSQFQLITWGADPTTGDFQAPDFFAIATAFGIAAEKMANSTNMDDKLSNFWTSPGPALLEIIIDPEADVVPMLLGGQKMCDMWMGRTA